ncbi:MAG: HAD-IIIC family phosphatase [Candidatus Omnitrophica bacterium]|nr:HAD-IIIC family phosphatase [Candidatus Omnitrophota bacterium]
MQNGHSAELDYFDLMKKSRKLSSSEGFPVVRAAILADFATQQLAILLKTLFHSKGVNLELYEAEYDSITHEVLDAQSGLYAFKPEQVIIMHSVMKLRQEFHEQEDPTDSFASITSEKIFHVWDLVTKNLPDAIIIQGNYSLPHERLYGNFDQKVKATFYRSVLTINHLIMEKALAHKNVFIHDVQYLASYAGLKEWHDEKLWLLSKSLCALEHLPRVAQNLVDISLSFRGRCIKCVVLDLDNTLWGGVIGEDGLEGIKIGDLDEGEIYTKIQQYFRALKRRGIVLAACSKNDAHNALLPFQKHPDMVLNEKDFAVFVANWNNKVENIKTIQQTLNIGFDSMVFIDDDPFERNLVRQHLPEVVVPEFPADPVSLLRLLSEMNLFESNAVAKEDAGRTEFYQAESQRQSLREQHASIDDYLKSLDMTMKIARFDSFYLPRIAQLIQRSNQFNLMTRRFSEAQCEQMASDHAYLPLYATLKDKFSDSGLISVVVMRWEGRVAFVEEWIMSCRVLYRGVEDQMMNAVFRYASEHGCTKVVGQYHPTAKNRMVEHFYGRYAFTPSAPAPDGAVVWEKEVTSYVSKATYMKNER